VCYSNCRDADQGASGVQIAGTAGSPVGFGLYICALLVLFEPLKHVCPLHLKVPTELFDGELPSTLSRGVLQPLYLPGFESIGRRERSRGLPPQCL